MKEIVNFCVDKENGPSLSIILDLGMELQNITLQKQYPNPKDTSARTGAYPDCRSPCLGGNLKL